MGVTFRSLLESIISEPLPQRFWSNIIMFKYGYLVFPENIYEGVSNIVCDFNQDLNTY